MAATIARRLNLKLNPNNGLLLLLRNHPKPYRPALPNPIPTHPPIHNPLKSTPTFFDPQIRFSSTTPQPESGQTQEKNPNPNPTPGFKHQEIEGPTVERDLSALANETRASLDALMRAVYGLSRAAAALGLAHLGAGAWLAYAGPAQASPEAAAAMVVHVAGFAFPFSVAFLLRRSLKPIYFFRKMEEQGRLQVLTLSLQAFKHLHALFARVRGISITCLLGLSVGVVYVLLVSH